jgi:hypothetical protein
MIHQMQAERAAMMEDIDAQAFIERVLHLAQARKEEAAQAAKDKRYGGFHLWALGSAAACLSLLLFFVFGHPLIFSDRHLEKMHVKGPEASFSLKLVISRQGYAFTTSETVEVHPGDSITAELSLRSSMRLEVGFLEDNGAWFPLFDPAAYAPGTHVADKALEADDHPSSGWLIAGSPQRVEEAKKRRDVSAVQAIRLRARAAKTP